MSFKKNKYIVIKNILSKDVVELAYNYIMRKKKVYDILVDGRVTSPATNYNYWGNVDYQVLDTHYASYGDVLMDCFLLKLQKQVEVNKKKVY